MNERVIMIQQKIGEDISTFSVSPFARWMGGTLIEAEEGYVKIAIKIRKEMCNPMDILHGGVASAFMDELMGWGIFLLNRETRYTTINLNVEFLATVKNEEEVFVETKVIRAGKKIIFNEAKILLANGKIAAKSTSSFCAIS